MRILEKESDLIRICKHWSKNLRLFLRDKISMLCMECVESRHWHMLQHMLLIQVTINMPQGALSLSIKKKKKNRNKTREERF